MQRNRPYRGLAFPLIVGLALLALAIGTLGALSRSTTTFALPGDGTVFHGGSTAGTSGTVQVNAGSSTTYVVSAVIPSGNDGGLANNLGGVHLVVDYDETKVSVSQCVIGQLQSASCNPNNGGKVDIAFVQVSKQGGQGIGATAADNPVTVVTITFNALAGAPNTANAIQGVQVVECLNGNSQAITCTQDLGALQIGSSSNWLVGDMNCSNTLSAADANILLGVILGRPGVSVGNCVLRTDMNCNGTTTAADANLILGKVLARAGVTIPETCAPFTLAPRFSLTGVAIDGRSSATSAHNRNYPA